MTRSCAVDCLNNGLCVTQGRSEICMCIGGFTGHRCQVVVLLNCSPKSLLKFKVFSDHVIEGSSQRVGGIQSIVFGYQFVVVSIFACVLGVMLRKRRRKPRQFY